MRKIFLWCSFLSLCLIVSLSYFLSIHYMSLMIIAGPVIAIGIMDMYDKKHTIIRNYPVFGRFRYIMEELRPKIYQYFIESDTDGAPLNRVHRSMVYQRAKKENDTTPFGTPYNIYEEGYEWINHSIYPLAEHTEVDDLRVTVGGSECTKKYSMSLLNISAMSYGSLSKTAIESLNWGAKIGNFYHNTGEGGISPYHKARGGDLVWQIGTGYFGCRNDDGTFNEDLFKAQAMDDQVKMIEIKLSQGAKPGHGGILPGIKNTEEIAAIRKVKPGITVMSPPGHNAFSNPTQMMLFVKKLRNLSGGKPVGFKLCVGYKYEFEDIVKAMIENDTYPDFITVDGGEGGTGSAPPEFTNSIGMSLKDGLLVVTNTLISYGIKDKITIICSGKIISGFDIVKALAMGADACNSARGMMLSLGCIQALVCHKNKCPTGVATQDPALYKGLVVQEKYQRVRNFHHGTLESVAEIIGAAGIKNFRDINRSHIWRRISYNEVKSYEDLFPYPEQNHTNERKIKFVK